MDADLRQLERRAALGDDDASAALLRRVARAGFLREDLLRLLAHVGDPGARRILGNSAPVLWPLGDPSPDVATLFHDPRWRTWKQIMRSLGKRPAALVATQAVRLACPLYAAHGGVRVEIVERLVRNLEAWVACPCTEHRGGLPIRTWASVLPPEEWEGLVPLHVKGALLSAMQVVACWRQSFIAASREALWYALLAGVPSDVLTVRVQAELSRWALEVSLSGRRRLGRRRQPDSRSTVRG